MALKQLMEPVGIEESERAAGLGQEEKRSTVVVQSVRMEKRLMVVQSVRTEVTS